MRALDTDLVAFTGDGPSVLGFLPCAAVVRRSAFLSTGGFPSRFGSCGEEELVALDLAAAGLGLAYVEDVVAHHHPAASASRSGRTRAELRNSLRTIWLRRRPWGAVVGTASTAARAVVTATPGRCWKPPPDCAGSRRSGGRFQRVERAVRMLEVQARPTG